MNLDYLSPAPREDGLDRLLRESAATNPFAATAKAKEFLDASGVSPP